MPDEEALMLQQDTGSYVPTTNIWDPSALQDIDVNSAEFKELFVRLYQNINNIANSLNLKETGYFPLTEFNTGSQYFPNPTQTELTANPEPINRSVFRRVYNFGALPNAATKTMPHELPLNSNYSFTQIYGCSTNNGITGVVAVPLPFGSVTDAIELWVDNTNINVKTVTDYSMFITTYIILEYIKQ